MDFLFFERRLTISNALNAAVSEDEVDLVIQQARFHPLSISEDAFPGHQSGCQRLSTHTKTCTAWLMLQLCSIIHSRHLFIVMMLLRVSKNAMISE